MDKLVSVIVPAYNVEAYIAKCLESIVGQTYSHIEIIVVNDGSKDATASIMEQIAPTDSRIRYVSRENGGLSAARNTGLDLANGEYICFVDSDDYVDEGYVETLVREIEGCDLAICGVIHETPAGVETKRSGGSKRKMNAKDTLLNMFVPADRSWGAYACNRLYKRSVLVENGLRFPEEYRVLEDIYFNYFYTKHCKNVCYTPVGLYHYITNEKGLVHNIENTPANVNKWLQYAEIYDPIMADAASWDRDVFQMLKMHKMIHNATSIRVLAHLGQRNHRVYKKKTKFLWRNLISFLFYRDIDLKKRLGAVLTALAPGMAFRIWNQNR